MTSTLSFASTNLSVDEGNSGTRLVNFTVQRVGDLSAVASVDWAVVLSTSPGSASLSDFAGGLLPSGTISFAAGEVSRTIAIAIAGDTVIEGNERLTEALSSPVNAVFAGSTPTQPTVTGTILADDGAVLSLAASGGQGYEGTAANGTVEFVVTRSGDTSVAASATWAVSLPTAPFDSASTSDFPSGLLPSGVVSFAAGETSKVISVPVLADAAFESNENFTLTLSAPSAGAVIGNATANGRILNDEGVPTLGLSGPMTAIVEGTGGVTTLVFTVTRTGDASAVVGATWSVAPVSFGATVDSADFVGGSLPGGLLGFAAGEMIKTFTVEIAGDSVVEPSELFQVQLSAATGGAVIGNSLFTGEIRADDGAVFDIVPSGAGTSNINASLGRFLEGNSGATTGSFVIFRTGDLSGTVSVDWSTVVTTTGAGTAAAGGADFVGGIFPRGTASFGPGETFKVIEILIAGDTTAESDESFAVLLSNPSAGATRGQNFSSVMLIGNDDPFATISLSPLTAVTEGNSGTTTYTLTFLRSGNTVITSTANWSVSPIDFNLTGADFALNAFPTGTITFAPGETSAQASFVIQGDTAVEGNETFFVSLSAPSAGTNIGTSSGTGTILNDDGATISMGSALSLAEGNSGNTAFNFTVTRSGDTSIAASANWAVSVNSFLPFPPQASAADFAGGTLPSGSVSFAAGETSKTITVNVVGDTVSESDEAFTVTLSAPSSGAAIGTATASGTIANDDALSGTVVQFSSGGISSVNEGNGGVGGQAVFTVLRSGNLSGSSTVNWAVSGSLSGGATANDFAGGVLPSGTVSFAAGQSSQTITINFAADSVIEPSESYSVLLSSPSLGTTLGSFVTQSGVINNDDGAIISLVTGVASQVEGNTGSTAFTFTFTRSNDLSSAVSANWAVGTSGVSSAVSASDFVGGVLPSGTVSFAAGETSKTITVLIQGDTTVEATESLGISLFDPSAGAVLGISSTSATVIDDDGAVLNIAGGARTVTEGNSGSSPITFTITRGGNTAITAVANWATSLISAGTADFANGMPPTGSVTFLPGETSKDVTINIAGDTAVEPNETFSFVISSNTVGSSIGTQSSVGVTIVNDDGAVIAFASPTLSVNEGNGANTLANITVTRSGDTSIAASANWAVSSSGGASGSDFAGGVLPSGVVSFAAGETSKTITIELIGDLTEEPSELFTVTLSSPSADAAIGLQGTTSVTIVNDDFPIDGGSGADSLVGNIGDNLLRGFGGNDTLDGGVGNDTLDGGEGADQLTGGTGADTFRLTVDGNGRSTLANMDVVLDFTESQLDVLSFGGSNGTLSAAGQLRTFIFNGSTGIELTGAPTLGLALPAQAHNIPMYQAYWLQGVGAAAGRGWIVVDVDSDERVSAQDMVAEVRGVTSGADLNFLSLEFLSGAQRASGLTAPTGTAGNDSLFGTGRSETFLGTTGSDTLDGGLAAFNTLSYASFATPITVTLTGPGSGTVAKSGGALGTDSFRNVYSILGGSGGDRFDATGLTQTPFYSGSLQGNGGNDTIIGGFTPQDDGSLFANAVVAYGGGSVAANIDLANGTASDGFGGTDTLTDIRRLSVFGSQNDTVLGTSFSDQVSSAATGDRTINLGAGTGDRWSMGTQSRDSITGAALSRVEVELGTGTSGGEFTGVARKYAFSGGVWTLAGTDTLRGVEQVNGSIGDDLIIGSDAANRFFGGEGNDTLNGGLGIDLVVFDSFTGASALSERGAVVNLTTGTATDSWGFTDTLISIENAYGTQQSDDMTGVSVVGTRTFLRGLVGNDVLRAPAVDTLVTADYRGDLAAVTVNLGTGLATDGWGDTDRLFSIQSVIGSRFGDVLTGGARNDLLEGFRGDDTLAGGAGTDVALFTGARADYTITRDSVTGALTVADNTAGRDGADLVAGDIETLRFSDGDFATSSFTTAPTTFLAIAPTSADKPEGNAGTTPFTFTVTRSGNTAGTASVAWAVVAGTATESDFPGGVLPSGSVSFAAGETSKVITVDVSGDTAGEPDQAFTVLLSGPVGAVITTASATGTIRNDDALIINGTGANDTITPGFVSANVSGGTPGNGNDVINGNAGNDSIDGGAGNDSINGGTGQNTLIGGAGNDTLNSSDGAQDRVSGGAGDDLLLGQTVAGNVVVGLLNPGLGNDTVQGNGVWDNRVEYRFLDRVDFVERTQGGVFVLGASGSATFGTEVDALLDVINILGTNQSDSFTGTSVNEYFTPGLGNDTVNGGSGNDRVEYSDLNIAVTINLATGVVTKGAQADSLTGIEDATGTRFGDSIRGNAEGNTFRPLGGNDTLDGGDGYDTVRYTQGQDAFGVSLTGSFAGVTVNLTTGIAIDNWGNTDTLLNFERADGSEQNDDLTGRIITDVVASGGRDTQLRGLGGNDTLRAPQDDARVNADYREDPGSVRVNLSGADVVLGGVTVLARTGRDGFGGTDSYDRIQGVLGSNFNDTIQGTDRADRLNGWAGNDSIMGGAGDDALGGGAGVDTLIGGAGFDTVFLGAYSPSELQPTQGAIVNLASATIVNDGYGNTEVLLGGVGDIENLVGTALADHFTGDAANNWFRGDAGNDTLIGGAGIDVAAFNGVRARYVITRDTVTGALTVNDTQSGGDGTDLLDVSIETLRFSDVDVAASSFAPPTLAISVQSASRAEGNSGSTAFTFTVTRSGDTAGASSAAWSVLAGTASASDFTGGVLPSGTVSFAAGESSKTITVNVAGDTTFEADEGFSVVLSAPSGASLGTASAAGLIQNDDVQAIAGTGANDTITPGFVSSGVTGGTPSAADDVISGFDGEDSIDGGGGNDSIDGGAGFDRLIGGQGDDTLIGGAGDDFFTPGAGNDSMVGGDQGDVLMPFDATGPVVIDIEAGTLTGQGNDVFTGIPNAHGTNFGDSISGSSANQYFFGRGGNDTIRGLGGNDNFFGGSGDDLLDGGEGNDRASYDAVDFDPAGPATRGVFVNLSAITAAAGGDTVLAGTAIDNWGGRDTLISIEDVTGSALADQIIGSGANNNLLGGGGNDTIEGGDGNDFINGGEGDDSLIGGAGNDFFAGSTGSDVIDGSDTLNRNTLGYNNNALSSGVTVTFTNTVTGSVSKQGGTTDSFVNVGEVFGTAFADSFFGSASIVGTISTRVRLGAGNDTVDGAGSVNFVVDYTDALKAINVNLALNTASQDGFDGTDTLNNVRFLRTSGSFNDTITGSSADEWFGFQAGGNKTVDGGAGSDMYRWNGLTAITATLGDTLVGGVPAGTVIKTSGVDTIIGIENFVGGSGNDRITGSALDNLLAGEAGADTIDGGAGFDTLDMNQITTSFTRPGRAIVNLSNVAITVDGITVQGGTALDGYGAGSTDTVSNIEGVIGTNFDDVIHGSAAANHLSGGAGNDTLLGGAGNDTLVGGSGTDVAVFSGARGRYAITRDAGTGALTVVDTQSGGDGTDLVDASIETLRFGGVDVAASTLTGSTLSIAALSADKAEGNAGSTAFTFTVTRTGDLSGVSSTGWRVVQDTAEPSDFLGAALQSGTITFAAGETTKVISVSVVGDTLVEGDETFGVVLQGWLGAEVALTGTSGGTIRNDDVPATVLSIAALSADKAEGNTGSTAFTFTVTRTGDTSGASSAAWSVGGANPNDFAGGARPSGTVSFAAGQTTQTITVNVAGDNTVEPDEAFTVTLATPTGATLGTSSATGTIRNDEFSTFSIAPLAASVAEGNAGSTAFTFTVSRTGNTALAASVNFAVTGSGGAAANAADFAGGVLPSGTVSFAAGEASRTLTINVAGDVLSETNEGFTVTLSAVSPNLLGTASATGTIVNDEPVTITGTPNPDTLNGTASNERLEGLASNDTLNGGGGDDTLVGGLGNDSLTGGAGVDRFEVDAGTDVVADLGLGGAEVLVVASGATASVTLAAAWTAGASSSNAGTASVSAQGFNADVSLATGVSGWSLSNAGSTRGVALTGGGRNDTLVGGNANDTLTGGNGNDSLAGNGGNDALLGGAGGDALSGDAGNDTLTGGLNNDTLTGGAGADRFVVDAGLDTVLDLGQGAGDALAVSSGATVNATVVGTWVAPATASNDGTANLTANGFNVNLSAATGANGWSVTNAGVLTGVNLVGSARADSLTGGLGNDTITGGAGNDTLTGGAGVDRFTVDGGTDSITDFALGGGEVLVIQAGATAQVRMAGDWAAGAVSSNAGVAVITAAGFDVSLNAASGASGWSVTNAGNARSVQITGSANADTLTGGDGADTLNGGGGADVLLGGSNIDRLTGGAGNDTMTGGAGADRFTADGGLDVVTDLGVGGVDVVVVSAAGNLSATLGASWIASGLTNSSGVASVSTAGFSANVALAKGTTGWSLSNAGSAVGVTLTGSARGDTLTGGSGADSLVGGAGNDTLSGGLGIDTLLGGVGADTFRFGSVAEANGDVIADFVAAQGDRIDLAALDANTGLGGDQAFVFVGSAAFSSTAGELRFAGGLLQGDVDGNGAADFSLALTGVGGLAGANFWL